MSQCHAFAVFRGGRLGSEEPGTTPPHHGEGKKQRQDETPAVPAKGAKGKEKGKEKGKDKGQQQDLQKGKAQEKGKGKAPSRVRADPTEEAHFRRLRAHRETAGRTRTSRTTGARSRTRAPPQVRAQQRAQQGATKGKEEGGKGTGKEPVPKSQGRVRRRRRKGHESRQPLQRPDRG